MHPRVGQVCLGKPGRSLHCQRTPIRKAKMHWCKVAGLNYEGVKGYCKLKQVVLKKWRGKDTRHACSEGRVDSLPLLRGRKLLHSLT